MNVDGFLAGYANALFGETDDEIFSFFRLQLGGLSSARFAKTIHDACCFLGDQDIYLEIGTYTGFTLLSAGYEHAKKCIGVDNFSQNFCTVGKVADHLKVNVEKYPGDYTVVDGDFRDVALSQVLPPEFKIGVFLIDGSHTYTDVMESIHWAKDHLSDAAIVFFDDLSVAGVKQAVDEIKQSPEFEEICFANSFANNDHGRSTNKYIHNGFSIMVYRKKALSA